MDYSGDIRSAIFSFRLLRTPGLVLKRAVVSKTYVRMRANWRLSKFVSRRILADSVWFSRMGKFEIR